MAVYGDPAAGRVVEIDADLDDARALLCLLDELRVEVAHLVGFSDGGEEALLMAAMETGRALSAVT